MRELQIRFTASGESLQGHTIDMGEWDITEGFKGTVFLHNPNAHAKAILKNVRNIDKRVRVAYVDEIDPLDTVPVNITIDPHDFTTEEEEKEFFTDLIDALSGQVKWVRP
jgi:hypothetical protein